MVSYTLPTEEGCGWIFLATPSLRPWMKKFARIMNLRPDEAAPQKDWPRMVFVRKDSDKNRLVLPPGFPADGWEAKDRPSIRFWRHRALPDIICEIGDDRDRTVEITTMLTSMGIIYLRTQEKGGLPVHAALLEHNGKGVLLAGPSRSGKSTSCGRLTLPWRVLSDDAALILRGDGRGYIAHPIPTWTDYLCGRSKKIWDVRRHVPVSAIFFLEKADIDGVFPLGGGEAAVLLNDSSTYLYLRILNSLDVRERRSVREKIFDNACEFAKAIPTFTLKTSLTGKFWEEMERVLAGETFRKTCPWGVRFAGRSNFQWGYFIEEGRLVEKYLKRPSDVLVIGSGNGREARPICRDGHRIVCIDIESMYLKSGQNLFAREGIQDIRFIKANMAKLPFEEESFNFIFFSLWTHAGKRRARVLEGIRRILRGDGLVLLTACTPLYKLKHPEIDEACCVADEERLRLEVSSCGFELLESAVDPARPEYRFSILKKQDKRDKK